MTEQTQPQYPVFVMCGRDEKRRKLLEAIDPEGKYKTKALLPFMGKRLIDWQLDVLRQSPYVEGLYLIGLSEEDAVFDYPVHYVPVETTADFAEKLAVGVAYLTEQGKHPDLVVISSSDTPAIRLEDINTFMAQLYHQEGYEFILSLVPEEVVEVEFPQSGRVVARFRDQYVFPGELYALSPRAIGIGQEAIREFSQRRRQLNRKKKKISLGPFIRYVARRPQTWLFLGKYLMGAASLADGERAFSAAFDCQTKAVIIPHASFGMDMDLPEDYQRLEDYMRRIKELAEL